MLEWCCDKRGARWGEGRLVGEGRPGIVRGRGQTWDRLTRGKGSKGDRGNRGGTEQHGDRRGQGVNVKGRVRGRG